MEQTLRATWIHIYVRYFLSSRLSTAAPRLDLSFWYELEMYSKILPNTYKEKIVDEALSSLKRHLWYLCPEQVVLALFDRELSEFEKQRMAETLISIPRPAQLQAGKPGQPTFDPTAFHFGEDRPFLSDFITSRSWLLFHLMDIQMPYLHWLTCFPSEWPVFFCLCRHPSISRRYASCE